MLSILAQRPVRKTRQTIWLICERKEKTQWISINIPKAGPYVCKRYAITKVNLLGDLNHGLLNRYQRI